VLDPAEYRINIFKEGYEDTTKTFLAKPGTNNLKISLKQKTGNSLGSGPASTDTMKKKPASSGNSSGVIQKENNQNSPNPIYQQSNVNNRPTSSKNIVIFIFDAMTNQPIGNVNVQVNIIFLIFLG